MTISQRIFKLLAEKGLKQNDLSEFTGISTSAISAWNKKEINPAADKLSIIADFFNVSIDYLLTGKENIKASNLSEDKYKLLEFYDNFTDSNKIKILERAQTLYEMQQPNEIQSEKQKKDKSKLRSMLEYENTGYLIAKGGDGVEVIKHDKKLPKLSELIDE